MRWMWMAAVLVAAACGSDDAQGDDATGAATGSTTAAASGGDDDGDGDGDDDDGGATAGGDDGDDDGSGSDGGDETGGEPPDVDEPTPAWFAVCDGPQSGSVIEADPTTYRDRLASMAAGDTLRLAPGTYDQGLPIVDMNGSAGSCFVIEGPADGAPAVLTGSSSRNTVSIRDSSFVVIENLELDGVGELGDAVKAEGDAAFAHHVTLENLYIHDHDATQQVVGISTKCPAWHWVIRGNRIESTGTGMYLGDSDGGAPFVGGLLERNVVLDTLGYGAQIKHQTPRPDVPGMPTQTRETIVRHNVWSKLNAGATGDDARPNLLLGHFPPSGPGVEDRYVVYGNFFHENPTEALLQAEGNVAIHGNVFVNAAGPGIVIQPHNGLPRRVDVLLNTIVTTGRGLRITGGDPRFVQRAVGNAAFGEPALEADVQSDNVVGAYAEAAEVLVAPHAEAGAGLDVHPSGDGLALPLAAARLGDATGIDRDFDGRARTWQHAGAYEGPADAGAWALDRAAKP